MRRVLFLGAGASAPFGIPITAKILPRIVQRLRSDAVPRLFSSQLNGAEDVGDDEEFLKEGLRTLYPGIDLDGSEQVLETALPYITEVLSFLDFLIFNGHPARPRWDSEKVSRLRRLFDRAICQVLSSGFARSGNLDRPISDTGTARVDSSGAQGTQGSALETWQNFREYIKRCVSNAPDRLTVITTNYDLLLDAMLGEVVNADDPPSGLTQIDVGFAYRRVGDGRLAPRPIRPDAQSISPPVIGPVASRLALYKLHGSLNYLRCEVCDQVYLNPHGEIAYLAFEGKPRNQNTCHCGHGPLRHVIVAPSTERIVRIPQILGIWSAAIEALRIADEWVFIGYSLPPEDLAIRSMLFRAWHARGQTEVEGTGIDQWPFRPHPGIEVVQGSERPKPAYKLLFGSHRYFAEGLEKWLLSAQRPKPGS
jgi:NAD-dependent SIR2 family protein deacetylase